MSHPDEGVLQELLDGELAPAEAAVIRIHLAGCAACAAALQELEAMQAEADAIVARLPLDPPLEQLALRAPAPRVNLRMIGLAASVVLVAGTSWMLFRSANRVDYFRVTDDSAAGLALPMPMPGEERQEVPATTSGAAPAPSAPAPTAVGADRDETAKQATLEGEKKEKDADGIRESELSPGNAAPPAAALTLPAESFRRLPSAERTSNTATTVAGAEARLGTRLRTISGLTPVSVEVLPAAADSLLTVRQRYVVGGVSVLLVQQALPAPRDEVTSKANEPAPRVMDDATIPPGNRASGFAVVADSAGVPAASRTWEAWGSLFQLRGALPTDSIDALMKRVK
jgi:cell division protein FtsN